MNTKKRSHRGMSSVLAMIYLTLMAALALGFYTAVDTGTNMADNEQDIHRSSTSAEAALAFAQFQLSQVVLPSNTTQANLLSAVMTQLESNVSNTANVTDSNGHVHNPTYFASGTPGTGSAAALASFNFHNFQSNSTYTPSNYGVIPGPNVDASGNITPNWTTTDGQGGQAYTEIAVGPNSTAAAPQLVVLTAAQDSNARTNTQTSSSGATTPMTRKLQLVLTASNPVFTYGLYSNGEIFFNSPVTLSGPSNGNANVFVVNNGMPIAVNSASNITGDLYWTSSSSPTLSTLTLDGLNSASAGFNSHLHPKQPTPAAPTFDTSPFLPYVGAGAGYGGSTYGSAPANPTITNSILTTSAATYVFNRPALTINGILYLQPGVSVTFNSNLTVNGCIVQANGSSASPGKIIFNGTVTQNPISSLSGANFPTGETALTGTFLLTQGSNVTVNAATNTVGSIIANSMIFNAATTVNGGSIMSLGGGMSFNAASRLIINPVGSNPSGASFSFVPTPTIQAGYSEVYP